MSLSTVTNIKSSITEPRPQIYFTREVNDIEDVNMLFDNTINVFHTMVFAAKQEQNETYAFKYILCKDYCWQLIDAMIL